jgi:hypothetical protein
LAKQIGNFQKQKDDDGGLPIPLNNHNVLDLSNEINLDELTQEDKFFLYQ